MDKLTTVAVEECLAFAGAIGPRARRRVIEARSELAALRAAIERLVDENDELDSIVNDLQERES